MITRNSLAWILTSSFSFLVASPCGMAAPPSGNDDTIQIKISDCVTAIRNDDVKWDGTFLGLRPTLGGVSGLLEKHGTKRSIPFLIEALKNKEQFVAAHVILTWLSGKKFVVDGGSWEGLHVEVYADGTVKIDERDQASLIKKWKAWSRQTKASGKSPRKTTRDRADAVDPRR